MKTLIVEYGLNHEIEMIKFGKEVFTLKSSNDKNYFEYGSFCVFISKLNWSYGLKFYVIENISHPYDVIINMYKIYLLLFKNNWSTKPLSIFKFLYKDKINWGIKVEKAEFSKSGKQFFNKDHFRNFCSQIQGLTKDEPKFVEIYGNDWQIHYPELRFYIGNRNLKLTNDGKTVLIDIDPRWRLDSK